MKKIIQLFILFSFLFSFSQSSAEKELLKIDTEFAEMAKEKGAKTAFEKFLAEKAEFITDNKLPITDRKKIIDFFSFSKYSYWLPQKAVVSKSKDLGYTYGISKTIYNDRSKDITEYYQYVSIWQKNKKGQWKMISDSGHIHPTEIAEKLFENK